MDGVNRTHDQGVITRREVYSVMTVVEVLNPEKTICPCGDFSYCTAAQFSDSYSNIGVYSGKTELMNAVKNHNNDYPAFDGCRHWYMVNKLCIDAPPQNTITFIEGTVDEICAWINGS